MEERETISSQIVKFVDHKLYKIMNSDDHQFKAQLARLRHGLGKAPGDDPELWALMFEDMPEEIEGKSNSATAVETAVYAALTLYAVHQQGKDPHDAPMHVKGTSVGRAIAQLAVNEHDANSFEALRKRFNRAATSADITEMIWHMRGIVQLLKRASIPFDHAMLARDLYLYQSNEFADSVRLRWGRDFYSEYNEFMRSVKNESIESEENKDEK